jgi:hypothetical protein
MVRPRRFSRRLRTGAAIPLALGGLSLLVAACSNSSSPAAAPRTTTTSSLPTPEIKTPTVTINGHTYQVPTDGGHPIDSAVDTSGEIVLTDKGFLPQREIVDLNQQITWTNLSSHPVTISFSHVPGTTPHNLAVGGTFTYSSSTLLNFEYVSSSGYHGTVAIGAFTS